MTIERGVPRRAFLSPQANARVAGVLYLVNIATSLITFSGKGNRSIIVASGLAATVAYIAVTVLLYYLFKPVSARLSGLAALFSLAGCIVGVLNPRHVLPFRIHSLVFFGLYCLMIATLILQSTFLPKLLGVLMAIAGLGWLTFVSSALAASLSPYHYIAGGVAEGLLALWLVIMGVDAARWNEKASGSMTARSGALPRRRTR